MEDKWIKDLLVLPTEFLMVSLTGKYKLFFINCSSRNTNPDSVQLLNITNVLYFDFTLFIHIIVS